jgi:fatty-acid desaturase
VAHQTTGSRTISTRPGTSSAWRSCCSIDVALFGVLPGALIWVVQMAWIPFWAAGVINGLGHFWGYRNFSSRDASTNIVPGEF